MNNKKIKTALVAAMITSTMAYNIPAINATTLTQKSVDNPVLVPTPKKVTYEENILSITNSVNIKGKDVKSNSIEIALNTEYRLKSDDGKTVLYKGTSLEEVKAKEAELQQKDS